MNGSDPINLVSAELLAAALAATSPAWAAEPDTADSDGLTPFPVTELYPPYDGVV